MFPEGLKCVRHPPGILDSLDSYFYLVCQFEPLKMAQDSVQSINPSRESVRQILSSRVCSLHNLVTWGSLLTFMAQKTKLAQVFSNSASL